MMSRDNEDSFKQGLEWGKGMGRFLGFWTVLLIMTLDASSGKDLLDVTVPLVEAYTQTLIHKH